MKAGMSKTARRKRTNPPSDFIEWDLLKHAKGLNPDELRSLSVVFARWSEQCRRFAEMEENRIPNEAHN
jgi:hypothetical protein